MITQYKKGRLPDYNGAGPQTPGIFRFTGKNMLEKGQSKNPCQK